MGTYLLNQMHTNTYKYFNKRRQANAPLRITCNLLLVNVLEKKKLTVLTAKYRTKELKTDFN